MPLAPPGIPAFPAGYGPLPSDFDTWVQNPLAFQTTGIVFRAEQHTAQALTSGSNTTITFGTIVEDPYSGWNATSHEWLVPYTGQYDVTLTVCSIAVAQVLGAVISTSNETLKLSSNVCSGSFPGGATAAMTVGLVAGQFIAGQAFTNQAGVTLSNANGLYTTMEISFASQ